MNLQQWLGLAIQASIILTVVSFGLTATPRDATFLFRNPWLLARTLLSMNIIMPVVAALIGTFSDFSLPVKFALVALSVSPVPPIVQKKQVAAGGRTEYVLGLMVAMSIFAVVLVPLTIEIINRAFGARGDISATAIGKIVATTVLIPIVLALAVRHFYPTAAKASRAIGLAASVILAVAVLVLLAALWPVMAVYIGNGVVVMLALMAVIGIVSGHVLGGPDPANREVLATSTASRHPAVAIAVASAFPAASHKDEIAIVVIYLIVAWILTTIYQKWQSRHIERTRHG